MVAVISGVRVGITRVICIYIKINNIIKGTKYKKRHTFIICNVPK